MTRRGAGQEGPQANSTFTFVEHNGRVYTIWLFPGSPQALEEFRPAYDEIVASFAFID